MVLSFIQCRHAAVESCHGLCRLYDVSIHELQGEELQYLTALMMQSEHWGWPQAAASFAQAAMRQMEVVYSQDNAPESDADRANWMAQRQNQESMFCANLFVYALEGGQYQVTPVIWHALGGDTQLEALGCVLLGLTGMVMMVPPGTACADWAQSGLDETCLFPAGLLSAHSSSTRTQC